MHRQRLDFLQRPFHQDFEELFAARMGRKHGIAVCNGSAALDAAVAALGIGPGDDVIMPTCTSVSCAAAVVRAGAMPLLVDSDPVTWNMNVDKLRKKVTTEVERKRNKRLKASWWCTYKHITTGEGGMIVTDDELLREVPGLQLPFVRTDYAENIYWVTVLFCLTRSPLMPRKA